MTKKTKNKNGYGAQGIKVRDKVWSYNPEVVLEVINVNETHAHVRSSNGYMSWEPIEELKKIIETEPASPVERARTRKC